MDPACFKAYGIVPGNEQYDGSSILSTCPLISPFGGFPFPYSSTKSLTWLLIIHLLTTNLSMYFH
jgi:hypothetical protein